MRGVATGAPPSLRPYLNRFFSRLGPETDQLIEVEFGCGNAMMTRATALAGSEPFDARSDLTGGEDDRLFARLRGQGARFGWAADAWVYEHAPPHRARVGYALKRAFCYGQSPSQTAARARDWGRLILNMAIGAGQASIYGATACGCLLIGRRSVAVTFLDRAVRGLGKVLWLFEVRLYGVAASPTAVASSFPPLVFFETASRQEPSSA